MHDFQVQGMSHTPPSPKPLSALERIEQLEHRLRETELDCHHAYQRISFLENSLGISLPPQPETRDGVPLTL